MTRLATVIYLHERQDLTPELRATLRRNERLQRAKDAALLSLHADLDAECERVGLTASAGMDEVRRIEEEIAALRRLPITRFSP